MAHCANCGTKMSDGLCPQEGNMYMSIGIRKPLSYEVHELSEGYSAIVYDADGQKLRTDHIQESEADEIVRSVNAHQTLVEALEEARSIAELTLQRGDEAYGLGQIIAKIDSALASAKGTTP